MRNSLLFIILILLFSSYSYFKKKEVKKPEYVTVFTLPYISTAGELNPDGLQCPIPLKDRVKNQTGIQCVYASIEMLGRWAEEPKLMDPPLTSRSQCKSYSSPSRLAGVLDELNIKYEQSHNNRENGLFLIRKAMEQGRGALFGVPGHAMVLVHFDEKNDIFKFVDNSDMSLKVQSGSIKRFHKMWDSWICVVYADKDIIPFKIGKKLPANELEILDLDHQNRNKIPIPHPTRRANQQYHHLLPR